MVQLIPDKISARENYGERVLFHALKDVTGKDDWIVLHGLHQYKVVQGVETEGDFIVLIPGKGIVVIEAKGATSAILDGEDWELEGVHPDAAKKSPLKQVEHVRNNVKALINTNDIDTNPLPIARVVWFPKMDPMDFELVGNKGSEYYPWEVLFKRDVDDVALVIEDAIRGETNEGPNKGRKYKPEIFDAEEMIRIKDILRVRAEARVSKDGLKDIRKVELRGSTDYLIPLWDAISHNQYIYVEGPAGTGKSAILKHAADTFAAQGMKVLVTCNGLMMADELALKFQYQPNVDVIDIGSLFLQTAQLKKHGDGDKWYDEELPTKAKNALMHNPHLAQYDVVCIDEFQDIAPKAAVVDAIFRYFGYEGDFLPAAVVVGDDSQQIMNSKEWVSGFEVAKELSGLEFFRVTLNRNVRQAPALSRAIYKFLGWPDNHIKHELNESMDSLFKIVRTQPDNVADKLAEVLKNLLETNDPEQIRVLSPFGEKKSLLAMIFQKEEHSKTEKWLMSQVRHKTSEGQIRWRSIAKFKGLEQDVIVITDINPDAVQFSTEIRQRLEDLLYVGMTRANFQVVLLIEEGLYPNA